MTGSTISGTIGLTVTLGGAAYPSPLTITSTGDVAVTVVGAIGLYAPADAGTLVNSGTIIGGAGANASGSGSVASVGGVGVDLLSGNTATNTGTITGGAGGVGLSYATNGGAGVSLAAGAMLTNIGSIEGGSGGDYPVGASGRAGIYVDGGTLINVGAIAGGHASGGTIVSQSGYSVSAIGYGSSGVVLLAGGTLTNTGTIIAGSGSTDLRLGGRDLRANNAVYLVDGATLSNTGILFGGYRGDGVFLAANASATLGGTIVGGTQGIGVYLATGASATLVGAIFAGFGGFLTFGVELADGGSVDSTATIVGGRTGYLGMGAVLLAYGGTFVNAGIINSAVGLTDSTPAFRYGGIGAWLVNGGLLLNKGVIAGGARVEGLTDVIPEPGSDAVTLSGGGTVVNYEGAVIMGGGGAVGPKYPGASGGAGVNLTGGSLMNAGLITGGDGGNSEGSEFDYAGGRGGTGISLTVGAILTNSGAIRGGSSGYGPGGGSGGAGVALGTGNDASTVVNNGSIAGGAGLYGEASGHFFNRVSGNVLGGTGASVAAGDSLINYGTITGGAGLVVAAGSLFGSGLGRIAGGVPVAVASGGTLINRGVLAAGIGAYVAPGGTLTNSSTIAGGVYAGVTADAVLFAAAGTLIVEPAGRNAFNQSYPGGTFVGQVVGNSAFTDVLDLSYGRPFGSSTIGTLSGVGTQFVNFEQITIASGADWTLTGANTVQSATTLTELASATLTDTGTLANYGSIVLDPSTLVVGGLTGAGSVAIGAGSTLDALGAASSGQTLTFGGSGAYLHFYSPDSALGSVINFDFGESIDLAGINPASVSFADDKLTFTGGDIPLTLANGTISATASSDGTVVTVICFCANTQILTPDGERAVQDLAVGDQVVTHRGDAREIVWIGKGKILATRGRRDAATPVIVRKGAFAENVPNRDLRVTKGHAFWFGGMLIPVEFLVNNRLIVWDDHAQEVELYHIELATHDVLIANGAPAESYRDDGNRWLFRNANSGWKLPPQQPCAPVLTGGPAVDAIWQRLLIRAGPRPDFALTDNPDLHLRVDGERVNATNRHGTAYIFSLPPGCASVRIVSNAAVPAELGLARDPRVLGVAIRRIALRQGTQFHVVSAADAALTEGFHPFEPDNGLRWTDGDATLPQTLLAGFQGPAELILHLGAATSYPLVGPAASFTAP